MYKLILSNNKQLGRLYSNGVIVWEMKKLGRRATLLRTEELSVETLGNEMVINRLKDDWDYIEIDGVRIDKTDGVFKKIFYTVFEITNGDKKYDMKWKMRGSYNRFSVRQYKYVEESVAPQRPSRKAFETKNVEVFNSVTSISISKIGRDWDQFEIEGIEVEKSDGTQYYKDFTIRNRDKVQAVIQVTGLRNYSIGNFVVRKFRGG
ncbi:hypothetical protein [Dolosigranulum savutiense]|uniref:Uncharacterized protein n=1 Tax=Dolosigranulum savutiense TaxID=3110288 RepID=A0AB74TYF5_9LACT